MESQPYVWQGAGMQLPVTYTDGQLQVHLPFAIDPQRLSEQLLREGYPLAHQPDTPDTQGWGSDFDPNQYYPYWVYPDPGRPNCYVFAFYPSPEDLVIQGQEENVHLGEHSQNLIARWLPTLQVVQQETH